MNYETFDFDSAPPTREYNTIADGELVRCLVLDFGYPTAYLKTLAEENKAAKEQAENLGLDFEEKKPSFKEGGVMAKVAIIYRFDKKEAVFGTGKTPVQPDYSCYTQISMMPPTVIYKKMWSSFTKGLMNVKKDGTFWISSILPNTFEAKNWETGALDPAKEEARQKEWDNIIRSYNELTEEEAHLWLLRKLSARFLFAVERPEGYGIIKPTTGLVFEAKVRRKDKSYLFDLQRFEWDKDVKQYTVYGNPFAYIDEESVKLATQIIAEREIKALQREQAKAETQAKEAVEDEVPF